MLGWNDESTESTDKDEHCNGKGWLDGNVMTDESKIITDKKDKVRPRREQADSEVHFGRKISLATAYE